MSVSRAGAMRIGRVRRGLVGATVVLLSTAALTACNADDVLPGADDTSDPGATTSTGSDSSSPDASETPEAAPASVTFNVRRGSSTVAVDRVLQVEAADGRLSSVSVKGTGEGGDVKGAISGDGSSWLAAGRLEPSTSYAVVAKAVNADGDVVTRRTRFSTVALSLAEQTYPSVAPLAGETVGVGMPVIVTFDVPVTDKASFENHMEVTTVPAQKGTWHWMSDTEAHYRPAKYWKAGTKVSVDVDVNSVPAGNGIFGQESRKVDFKIGDAHVYKVDAQTHQMKVYSNGKMLRQIPITTGKAGFTTRSGIKVIIEKFDSKRMNSETVGIPAGSADAYDIDNVQWAMRLTYSGEFIHAAPWSVGSQGYDNVSHGCTGMSTSNADWLYHMTQRGDVVEYTGTDRPMTLDNGYGDWNESFKEYAKGSALH